MSENMVALQRVIKTNPEKVYRAFLEGHALATWLPPWGFIGVVQQLEAKVGGSYKMSFTNFTTGNSHSFGGEFIVLTPFEYIQYTDRFDNPNMPGEMTTTIALKKVLVGTELKITQEGIPESIPVEMCYLGWQDSLEKLSKLVEPNIPDA